MARHGAFDNVGAAMMVHPADADLISMDCVALQELHVQYHGKAAHAAAAPWDGRNALGPGRGLQQLHSRKWLPRGAAQLMPNR